MNVRSTDTEKSHEGFNTFIDASKRASERGDFSQAERLLKTSLKQSEQQLASVERALLETLESLLKLYETQGRIQEVQELKNRHQRLTGGPQEH